MKAKILISALAVSCLALNGCQQAKTNSQPAKSSQTSSQQTAKSKSNKQESTKQSTSKEPTDQAQETEPAKEKELWNSSKNQELASFMSSWGSTMKQDYQQYDGTTPLHTSTGIDYPDYLSQELVDGQSGLIGWEPTGKGSYQYNVVAIYNHDGDEPPLPNRITYFFCFDQKGTPIVLVDESRDGPARAESSQNQQLVAGFTKIAQQ